ncbi:hypothetical protein [Pseudoalteromonas sp. T1lg22]|uniref:hypothetical protein n=1 Tax=Pseudoalteromonas sp. T1lg22 TaxID=2077096 RepID=UPI000CF640BB|nr:hypothetical protein [Pseudoalteromonas sp. T1lg22]
MPYELKFTKKLDFGDEDNYFNECCYGGDIIVDLLLPGVRSNYLDIQDDQEDWGWFIWFSNGKTRCAIDVFCDDPVVGDYTLHVTCYDRERKFMIFSSEVENKIELERVRDLVVGSLKDCLGVNVESRYESKFA